MRSAFRAEPVAASIDAAVAGIVATRVDPLAATRSAASVTASTPSSMVVAAAPSSAASSTMRSASPWRSAIHHGRDSGAGSRGIRTSPSARLSSSAASSSAAVAARSAFAAASVYPSAAALSSSPARSAVSVASACRALKGPQLHLGGLGGLPVALEGVVVLGRSHRRRGGRGRRPLRRRRAACRRRPSSRFGAACGPTGVQARSGGHRWS